jgi:hypothetical protein
MSLALRLGLMALGGVSCGVIARVLSGSVRGRFATQVVLHRLIDGIAVVPGIALFFWLAPIGEPTRGLENTELLLVFMATYAGTRILTHRWLSSKSASREKTVPFQHWLELMQVDPPAAHQFLKAYLADRGSHALGDLRVACANLERKRSEERHVLVALDQLRAEIARREEGVLPGPVS